MYTKKRTNGGYRKRISVAEDYELWLRMMRNGVRFECLPDPVIKIRRHESNMSATRFKSSTQSCLRALFEHIFLKRKGIDFACISLELRESVMKQALELLDTTCLVELLCWRHDLADKTKTYDVNAFFGFGQCLFNQNKREILFRKRKKVGDVDLCGETILGNEKFIDYRQKSELEKKKYKEDI